MDQSYVEQPDQTQIHARRIETEIESLRAVSHTAAQNGFKGFWAQSKQIISLFKSLKPLKPQDRQHLWASYRAICDGIHEQQALQQESLVTGSRELRKEIETAIGLARESLADESLPGLIKARELLRESLRKMKSEPDRPLDASPEPGGLEPTGGECTLLEGYPPEPTPPPEVTSSEAADSLKAGQLPDPAAADQVRIIQTQPADLTPPPLLVHRRLLKNDREECWRQWQEVRNCVQLRLSASHARIAAAATELSVRVQTENPPTILKIIRQLQPQLVQLGLPREQRELLRKMLNEAWNIAIRRLQALREERKLKHQAWRTRMEENLERWYGQLETRERSIAHLHGQIDKLQEMLLNARSEEHRERIRGWIEETTERLQSNESIAQTIRGKISAVEAKLQK